MILDSHRHVWWESVRVHVEELSVHHLQAFQGFVDIGSKVLLLSLLS